MDRDKFIALLKREIVPALGVTEPSTIAFACAAAYQRIGGNLAQVELIMDRGLFKNAYSCAIPGTDETGIEMAALLGILVGDSDLGLQVLRNITAADLARAKKLKGQRIVSAAFDTNLYDLYLAAAVTTSKGQAKVVIKGHHTNIVRIEVNGSTVYKTAENERADPKFFDTDSYKLAHMITFAEEVPLSEINFVLEAVAVNERLLAGGRAGCGMQVGPALERLAKRKLLGADLRTQAEILTASTVDARMGGLPLAAMSICGSGNHGIIATMPLVAVARAMDLEDERLARAIAISYLVTIYIKNYSGRLSAFCGCAVAAGTGASAGIVHLLGGGLNRMEKAINNMAANLTGIICDGGNFGCSLKAANGAGAAVLSALLAMENISVPKNSGIVGETAERTMQNMGLIASPGMLKTNDLLLRIMTGKD